jgi:hypothetical protein
MSIREVMKVCDANLFMLWSLPLVGGVVQAPFSKKIAVISFGAGGGKGLSGGVKGEQSNDESNV